MANSPGPQKPQLRRVVTIESLRDDLPTAKTANNMPRPSPAPRQKTEPAPLSKERNQSIIRPPHPKLARTITAPPAPRQNSSPLALKGPALITGGLVGCAAGAAVLLGVQLWYDFAGAESALLAAKSARLSMDNLTEELIATLKAGTYSADEALDILRRTTLAYASTIPGGAGFVERVFREIDTVRKQRGREVDKVVAETYALLAARGRAGAGETEMRDVVLGQLGKLSRFAGTATRDVVARNPGLKPVREEAVEALQGTKDEGRGTPTVRVNMAVRQKQGAIKR